MQLYEILTRNQLWEAPLQSNLAFTPDRKALVTAADVLVHVRDTSTGKELLTLPEQVNVVSLVALSPNANRLATVSGETVKVWDLAADLASGHESMSLSTGTETVTHIVFSPDSSRPAIASDVWIGSNSELFRLPGQMLAVTNLTFSLDRTRLATASDHAVHLRYAASAGGPRGHRHPEQHWAGNTTITLLEPNSNSEPRRFAPQTGHLTSLTFCLDGTRLAMASDHAVHLRDATSGDEVRTMISGRNLVVCSPNGKRLACPGEGAQATVWDVDSGEKLVTLFGQNDIKPSDGVFNPDWKRLATTSSDGRIRVWDVASGRSVLNTLSGDPGIGGYPELKPITYSPDGKLLATASGGHIMKVFDAVSGSEVLKLHDDQGEFWCVAFSRDGTRLVTGGSGYRDTAKIWDEASGKVLHTFNHGGRVRGVAFSPDGKRVVTAGENIGKVWDVASGNELFGLSPPPEQKWGIFFSPDGKKIATEKQVWEAGAGRQIFAFPETGSSGPSKVPVALSPDPTRLATSIGERIKIWDAASGNELLTLDNDAEVKSLAFILDGTYLAAIGPDWTVRLHALRIEDLMAVAHKRFPRELSAEERQKYLHTK